MRKSSRKGPIIIPWWGGFITYPFSLESGAPGVISDALMQCSGCGRALKDGASQCIYCGAGAPGTTPKSASPKHDLSGWEDPTRVHEKKVSPALRYLKTVTGPV